MKYSQTVQLFYEDYDDLDNQLTLLERKGWRVIISREEQTEHGFRNYITFIVHDK